MKLACCRVRWVGLFGAALLCVLCGSVVACGGGGSNGTTSTPPSPPAPPPTPPPAPPPTPPPAPTVTVSCTPAAIVPYGSSQCTATVQGSTNSAVTWSADGGSIDSSGLFTAPATVQSVTVRATDTQNSAVAGTATISVQLALPASKHVVLVMEENQDYSTVVGNTSDWPSLNNLIANGALATNYFADSHPSIGNYFMLTTGQLLTTNDNSTTVFKVDNIARRMLAANASFKVYAEGITQGYVGGDTGLYLIRHNPLAMLSDVADSQTVANSVIQPFAQFQVDAANNALPEFSFIVPDVDDDAHNGTPVEADSWLQANVVNVLAGVTAFQSGGDGVLMVDFDEAVDSDTAHGGGHVAPVFWGPNVTAGFTQKSSVVYQHENMLATIMGLLGLPNPPGNAASAQTMAEFFAQ